MKSLLRPLTSLRFFAAFAVVLQHLHLFEPGGSAAVEFFFVLSGFILTYGYESKLETINLQSLSNFWILRFARLYPVYVLTGITAASLWIGSQWPFSLLDIARSLFAMQVYFDIGDRVYIFNGPSWSVADEFFFYACFPFILAGLRFLKIHKSAPRLLSAWIIIFALRVAISLAIQSEAEPFSFGWWLLYISPYTRIAGFIHGVILGYVFLFLKITSKNDTIKNRTMWTIIELFAILMTAAMVSPQLTSHSPRVFQFGVISAIPICFAIYVFALGRGWLSRILSSRLLVHLGEISFSIYMIHAIVFEWASRFMNHEFYDYSNHSWHIMAQIGLVIVVLALSDIIFRYIEEPVRKYAKSFVTQRDRMNAAVTVNQSSGQVSNFRLPAAQRSNPRKR